MTPEELARYVNQRMQEQKYTEGMLLYGTIGFAAYLRPDGSVVFEEAVDWAGGSNEYRMRPTTAQEAAGALHVAVKRHPELSYLIPPRRPYAECPTCQGTGSLTRPDGLRFEGVWCERCTGLGYFVE